MKRVLLALLLVAAVVGWRDWNRREIVHPPGVLVPETPRQAALAHAEPLVLDGYRLTPRASFRIRARVLSREDYWFGDEADLSPVDLALGWGAMSDQAVLDRIDISQGNRWYFTRYQAPAPLADGDIVRSSGNMHILPADSAVRRQLKRIRRGHVLQARGYLVDVEHESGFRWHTSLSREDSGQGACEIFYVEQLSIEADS
jgi:hypothetical protein